MANAIWMVTAWSLMALNPRLRPQVLIFGTDPVLSPLVAVAWRAFRPDVKIAHWCFDLYPEAAISAGLLRESSWFARGLKALLVRAYGRCDLIVDIGGCMRRLLSAYGSRASSETITPWALVEPPVPAPVDLTERRSLFGDACLGLLYSGSFGRAHSTRGIPELAKALEREGGKIVFSVQGNAVAELQQIVHESKAPIEFAEFAPSHLLEKRLCAADVHVVSLQEEWTGTVVPSKFFGALAIGRPVLFVGSGDSAIARWIEEHKVGWVLNGEQSERVLQDLIRLSQYPEEKNRLFSHCHAVYRRHFSRSRGIDRWDGMLRHFLDTRHTAASSQFQA